MKPKSSLRFYMPLLVAVILLSFNGCKKEYLNISNDCEQTPLPGAGYGSPIIDIYPIYRDPYFNPNNPDEVIFTYRKEEYGQYSDLIKYNLKTKEHQVLLHHFFGNFSNPQWSTSDWIIMALLDGVGESPWINLYKMRSDGSHLTALTTSGRALSPRVNLNGDQIIYELAFSTPITYMIINLDGELLHTQYHGSTYGASWQHPSLIAYSSFRHIGTVNPYSEEDGMLIYQDTLTPVENNSKAYGACWISEEEILGCIRTGVFIANINTKEVRKFLPNCPMMAYSTPSYAPASDKIIFSYYRVRKNIYYPQTGRVYRGICTIDLDGSNFEVISIEE